MWPPTFSQYDALHQLEPQQPTDSVLGPLLERASDLSRAATALGNTAGYTAQLKRPTSRS